MVNAGERPLVPLNGLVLAGGYSRRFGSDKAAIQIAGHALLDTTIGLLIPHVASAYVSVRADQTDDALRRRFPVIPDSEAGLGPAAGILAAHAQDPHAAWLVLACDMPGLNEAAIRNLIESRNGQRAATAYISPVDGLVEPLCAIYEPATLARFRIQVAAGAGRSPRGFLSDADVELLVPVAADVLLNVNTPADMEQLEK